MCALDCADCVCVCVFTTSGCLLAYSLLLKDSSSVLSCPVHSKVLSSLKTAAKTVSSFSLSFSSHSSILLFLLVELSCAQQQQLLLLQLYDGNFGHFAKPKVNTVGNLIPIAKRTTRNYPTDVITRPKCGVQWRGQIRREPLITSISSITITITIIISILLLILPTALYLPTLHLLPQLPLNLISPAFSRL